MRAPAQARIINGEHSTCAKAELTGSILRLPGDEIAVLNRTSERNHKYVVTKVRFFLILLPVETTNRLNGRPGTA